MSFDALAWAAKQNTGSSGTKLVLLGLAECADRQHRLAFPSIAALVEFSSLDRKSVITNLLKLEGAGFIRDSGRRVGATKQIKVYELLLETVPETGQSQKRNSSENSDKGPKNGTRNKSEPVITEAKASYARVVDAWNEMAKPQKLPLVRALDNSRKQSLRLRLKEHGEALILEAIATVGRSPWLKGEGRDGNWRPTLDFILQPSSLLKVLEGAYGGLEAVKAPAKPMTAAEMQNAIRFHRATGNEDRAGQLEAELADRTRKVVPIGQLANDLLRRAG